MRFPSPSRAAQVTESALSQFIDGAAGVVSTELARLGVTESALSQFIDGAAGVVIHRASEAGGFTKGGGHHSGSRYTPPASATQRFFFL